MDIEKAKERQKKLAESIRRAEARLRKKDDTIFTRKKILIGAFVMSNEELYQKYIESESFDVFLKRNRDRELFGLAPIMEATSEITPAPKPKNDDTARANSAEKNENVV